jgi:D-3-phosphoglycerate dehydrogenase
MGFVAVRLNALSYPVEDAERRELEKAGAQLIAVEGQEPEEILAAAENCDALLVVSSSVPAEVVRRLARCRVISRLGAGTDKIAIDEATRQGIVVANVPDFCTNEQAEHAFALLLAWARRLPFMFAAMRRGEWTARNHQGVHRVAGQTLGLIGFGLSAQAVAARAAAFGMRSLAWTRDPVKYATIAERCGVTLTTLDRVLDADYVSIHLPLTSETRGLIDAARIGQMRPTAVLINTARGAIVDESALVSALEERRIGGAALDVFDGIDVFALPGEPPRHPLLELDNVLLTPHCAGSSVESTIDSKTRGARQAADVLSGRWPRHVVNPEVLPRYTLSESIWAKGET